MPNISIISTQYESGYNVTTFGATSDAQTASIGGAISAAVGRDYDKSYKNAINNYLLTWVGVSEETISVLMQNPNIARVLFVDDPRSNY